MSRAQERRAPIKLSGQRPLVTKEWLVTEYKGLSSLTDEELENAVHDIARTPIKWRAEFQRATYLDLIAFTRSERFSSIVSGRPMQAQGYNPGRPESP